MAKLYFYYAAMNAGKSTTLLQADFNYRERGMETMLWTAAFDDRSGAGTIGSRIALSAPAHTFDEGVDMFEAVAAELKKRPVHCVLVDEAQFLSQPQVLQLCEVADQLEIPVLCYGLRTDFQAKLFPGFGGAARPCRHARGAEGCLRMRAQGDDEPSGRCRRPRGGSRPADRDRRQRPLHRAVPQAFFRALAREPGPATFARPRQAP